KPRPVAASAPSHADTPAAGMATPQSVAATPSAGPEPAAPSFALVLEGSLNYLTAKIEATYGDRRVTLSSAGPDAGPVRRHARAEGAALERLQKFGFTGPGFDGLLVLKTEPKILTFFATELPRLQREWKVKVGERFEHVTRDIERVQPRLEVRSSGENWFDLQIDLTTPSGEHFSAADIQRLLQSGRNSVQLKNKKVAVFEAGLLDEFQQVLQDCDPQQRQPGTYRVDRRHAAYLATTAHDRGAKVNAPADWERVSGGFRDPDQLPSVPLGALETVLRPYQKHGVFWLNALAENGMGGILADEMGLGKTLQALAFLRASGGKAIIVCPSSLIFNWCREADRFTPELRVLPIQGPDRERLFGAPLAEADLVITSYPLLRRDAERYRDVEFTTAILDEAQHIKNPESQNAQSALMLRARHRFVLTGTPVENSIRDIWSLMNFLMPGYLGKRDDFRERFEKEIESQPNGPAHRRLVRRLRPFILRRLKRNVLKELPEKIEQVAYCELSAEQQQVYTELVKATRRQASEWAGEKDRNKARILMLTALLRLRQACCDLRLLGADDAQKPAPSGKLDMLLELLGEAVDGGHQVLVFSQFVSMLTLLREALEQAGHDYCYLDGQTRDRAAQVDRFQAGGVPAFLISLKAGGVGLNLTAADTVIHFDPWWNPAVEAQATDRAHRIGQAKVVTSYKLIARGTVEEKILALQARKRAVIEATLENEQPLMEGLGIEDIAELLA
ncbi:MAG TPA: DEAD/DEAH box helicase, partial [Chthoniobacteraceae bacterium]|nr:DEAD/DEAH box helicase [Chthoniobacteraceae bacterium]